MRHLLFSAGKVAANVLRKQRIETAIYCEQFRGAKVTCSLQASPSDGLIESYSSDFHDLRQDFRPTKQIPYADSDSSDFHDLRQGFRPKQHHETFHTHFPPRKTLYFLFTD